MNQLLAHQIRVELHERPLPEAVTHLCIRNAFSKLSAMDQFIVEDQADRLAHHVLRMGPVSAMEVLAKIGMLLVEKGQP